MKNQKSIYNINNQINNQTNNNYDHPNSLNIGYYSIINNTYY